MTVVSKLNDDGSVVMTYTWPTKEAYTKWVETLNAVLSTCTPTTEQVRILEEIRTQ